MALHWVRDEDGEYNEEAASDVVGGLLANVVTIYSDREGEVWMCRILDGDDFELEAKDKWAARREAEREWETHRKEEGL